MLCSHSPVDEGIQFRANVQQSLAENHPHLKGKVAAWLHRGFS